MREYMKKLAKSRPFVHKFSPINMFVSTFLTKCPRAGVGAEAE